MKALLDIVQAHNSGRPVGIYSVCSSHPFVLEAALALAARQGNCALIESTSNQVNQDGGYTGMRPAEFRREVLKLADAAGLPSERVLLGGDHLGPNCWRALPAVDALARSSVLVRDYVEAGFRKIHLDCSMSCADDPLALGDELIAERTSALCEIAEDAWRRVGGPAPVYVIGSEVPVPGGAHESLDQLAVTTPAAAHATLDAQRREFLRCGLDEGWQRVIGLVVQPGVEFDHHKVIDYRPSEAFALSQSIVAVPGIVFEAHSTDYQRPAALAALVRDHFAILKVGPAVTFALREAFWGLAEIAVELGIEAVGGLKEVIIGEMRRDPTHWAAYYRNPESQHVDLQYSLSDRIRYYWGVPAVARACARLLEHLAHVGIPQSVLSQYLPDQYEALRDGRLPNEPRAFVLEAIKRVLRDYAQACDQATPHENVKFTRGAA